MHLAPSFCVGQVGQGISIWDLPDGGSDPEQSSTLRFLVQVFSSPPTSTVESSEKMTPSQERLVRRAMSTIALVGLAFGCFSWLLENGSLSSAIWAAGTIPIVVGLALSITRDLIAGRLGVDAVAMVSMIGALILGEYLAGAVVAVMYAGGNLLEDFAVARAERSLKQLVDRVPRFAHLRI